MIPFWHGEAGGRTLDLGLAQGQFLRTLSDKLDDPDCLDWLQREHFLDDAAARNVRAYVRRRKGDHDPYTPAEALKRFKVPGDLVIETAADTVNPSLWRQAQMGMQHGLFQVTDRGYKAADQIPPDFLEKAKAKRASESLDAEE